VEFGWCFMGCVLVFIVCLWFVYGVVYELLVCCLWVCRFDVSWYVGG